MERSAVLPDANVTEHSLSSVHEGAGTDSDIHTIVHELRYIIGMNIEKLAMKLRVNLDASRRPRCLRAETCCGQDSSPFLPPPNPPYSPIATTLLQNCTNIPRLSGVVTMFRSQRSQSGIRFRFARENLLEKRITKSSAGVWILSSEKK